MEKLAKSNENGGKGQKTQRKETRGILLVILSEVKDLAGAEKIPRCAPDDTKYELDSSRFVNGAEQIVGHRSQVRFATADLTVRIHVVEQPVMHAGVDGQEQVHHREAGVVGDAEGRAASADVERPGADAGGAEPKAVYRRVPGQSRPLDEAQVAGELVGMQIGDPVVGSAAEEVDEEPVLA